MPNPEQPYDPQPPVLQLDREIRSHGARLTFKSVVGLIIAGMLFYQLLIDTNVIKHPYRWYLPTCHTALQKFCKGMTLDEPTGGKVIYPTDFRPVPGFIKKQTKPHSSGHHHHPKPTPVATTPVPTPIPVGKQKTTKSGSGGGGSGGGSKSGGHHKGSGHHGGKHGHGKGGGAKHHGKGGGAKHHGKGKK